MNKNLIVTISLVAIVASSFALGAFLSLREKTQEELLGKGSVSDMAVCTASTTVYNFTPTTSQAVLAATGRRCGFAITNRIGNGNNFSNAYYGFGTSIEGFTGVIVSASTTDVFSNFGEDINYTDAVSVIAYATGTISITEFRY